MDNNVNLVLLRSVFEIALAIDLLRSRWNIHGLSYGSDSKESAHNAGDPGSIPGLERSPGEGNGNPFQYSCLENIIDRGA